LTRTFKLHKKALVSPDKGALVQVESDAGATYVLPVLLKSGIYGRPSLNLDPIKKCRLRIRTKENKEFLSAFVESKISPPIDKVTHDFRGNPFNLYISTMTIQTKADIININIWKRAAIMRHCFLL